jgi:ribosome-associated protein YbcJ (S4-like RNA binding protein)
VNGAVEHRIRNKLIAGAIVSYNGNTVVVEK